MYNYSFIVCTYSCMYYYFHNIYAMLRIIVKYFPTTTRSSSKLQQWHAANTTESTDVYFIGIYQENIKFV